MTETLDTIGLRLRAARENKGMSVEDAAFETRIHAPYIRGLENDDYSAFASATYAKSFLSLYSRFLGVDASEALRYFESGNDTRLSGAAILPTLNSSVSTVAVPARRDHSLVRSRGESPGMAPVFIGLVVLALVVGIPLLWFLGKDAESIDDVTSRAKSIAEATRPDPSPVASADTPPTTPPAPVVPEVAAVPPTPPAASPETDDNGPKAVAADWVLSSSTPREPKPAPAAEPPSLALVTAAPGLQNLAPTPLRAVPSEPDPIGTSPKDNSTSESVTPVAVPSPAPAPAEAAPPQASLIAAVATPTPATKSGPTKAAPEPAREPQVIRATPLIAVPIAIPTEPEENATGTAGVAKPERDPEEIPFVDPNNRFPRPVE